MKPKAPKTMTETLRQAIHECGLPMLTLATETGIERASLIRFARGDQSLRLDIADRLAVYFGFELQPTKAKGKGR
jgi:plasmid maintenance system antidote protein VapI